MSGLTLDVEIQEEGEDRADRGDGGDAADLVPARGDGRVDDIGSELKREPRDEPVREREPDGALCRVGRVPRHYAEDPDDRLDGADRDDQQRERLQDERNVVRGKI